MSASRAQARAKEEEEVFKTLRNVYQVKVVRGLVQVPLTTPPYRVLFSEFMDLVRCLQELGKDDVIIYQGVIERERDGGKYHSHYFFALKRRIEIVWVRRVGSD